MRKVILGLGLLGASIFTLASCGSDESSSSIDTYEAKFVAPQGAPAIALADAVYNNKIDAEFIAADYIKDYLVAGEADFIVAPINAGAELYNEKTSYYQLASVLTWGNIYFATQRTDVETIDDFAGKTVTIFGESTINASIAKSVLKDIDVNYATSLETAAATNELLISDSESIVLTAEPALSAAVISLSAKNKSVKTFSVSALFGNSYAQAGLFVSERMRKYHKDLIDDYLDIVFDSCDVIATNLSNVVNECIELINNGTSLGLPAKAPVLTRGIPYCNIVYQSAKAAKSKVEATANVDLQKFGGVLPLNEFYYA